MSELLYKKVGKRYKPVSAYAPEVADDLPQGAHLIIVDKGWRSTRYNVNPDHAAVLAALRLNRKACMDAMREAKRARPEHGPLRGRELKAFNAYKEIMGDAMLRLTIGSASDIVDAMESSLVNAIEAAR